MRASTSPWSSLFLGFFAGFGFPLFEANAIERPPNFIVLLADDMSPGDVSAYNPESAWKTPNIDRLGERGMLFTHGHSPAASCTPSRYSLLTGRYPHRTWLKSGVVGTFGRAVIPEGETTIAEFLSKHGYATGFFGKWHLGMKSSDGKSVKDMDYSLPVLYGPNEEGFRESLRATSANSPFVYIRNGKFVALPTERIEAVRDGTFRRGGGPITPDFKFEEVQADVTRAAIEFMRQAANKKEPFFAYVAYSAPHHPMLPSKAFEGKTGVSRYGDFILELDHRVGEVLDALKDEGLDDNTLVIFASDNGVPPYIDTAAHEAAGHDSTMGLRGIKMDLFEGGHRVPFLAQWPAKVAAGSQSDQPVGLNDLFATFADAAGQALPVDVVGDSVSLLPILEGKKDFERPPLAVQGHHGTLALIDWPWKFMATPDSGGLETPPFKDSPEAKALPRFQLYNLQDDPGEMTNLYPDQAERAGKMAAHLADIVRRGRSTPGVDLLNAGGPVWEQVNWIKEFPAAKSTSTSQLKTD